MNPILEEIKKRLQQELPGFDAQILMASSNRKTHVLPPEHAKQSGVLLLLFLKNEQWYVLLMQRTEDGNAHSGQISFPGGKVEKQDKSFIETALRECEEEIGIPKENISILGTLSSLYIPASNFVVNPTVGYMQFDEELISLSQNEVKEILIVPIKHLYDNVNKQTRIVQTNYQKDVEARAYILPKENVVWGATAMILSEFEQITKDLFFY